MKTANATAPSAREMAKHKNELRRMGELQKAELAAVKENHQLDLEDAKHTHRMHIDEELQRKEKILNDLKSNMEKTRELTDQQIKHAQETSTQRQAQIKQQQMQNIEQITNNYDEVLNDKNIRYNQAMREAQEEAELKKNELNTQNSLEYRKTRDAWMNKLDQQKTEFNESFATNQSRFEHLKHKQADGHKKALMMENQKGQQAVTKMNQEQIKQFAKVEEHHDKQTAEQQLFHEKQYQTALGTQQKELLDLNKRFHESVNKNKEEVRMATSVAIKNSSDPFFAFTDINPQVQETETAFIVKVPLPEYAKEELRMTSNGRTVVLTFDRRHQDTKQDEFTSSKINRIETIVKKFELSGDFKPREVKVSYDNGVKTFHIPKVIQQKTLA
jgi:HSP20 family molecular chaperone IbpA